MTNERVTDFNRVYVIDPAPPNAKTTKKLLDPMTEEQKQAAQPATEEMINPFRRREAIGE